jgi:acylphosphatase
MTLEPESEPRAIITRFEKLLASLARSDVDLCVVGGLAVVLNGYVRVTEDVDILVNPERSNIERMLGALRQWGEGWARGLILDDFSIQEGSVRVCEQEFDRDIFVQMRGNSLESFRPALRYFDVAGTRVLHLGPRGLILLKQDSWREKDQRDTQAMREALQSEPASNQP